jgi:hypothetical protein
MVGLSPESYLNLPQGEPGGGTNHMSISKDKWFEVWFDEEEDVIPTYLLIVTPDPKQSNLVLVVDSHENNRVIHQGQNYEATRLWLQEDEYSLVDGRVFTDDGWQIGLEE